MLEDLRSVLLKTMTREESNGEIILTVFSCQRWNNFGGNPDRGVRNRLVNAYLL